MKEKIFIISIILLLYSCSKEGAAEQSVIKPQYTNFEYFVGQEDFASFDATDENYTLNLNNPNIISWEYTKNKGVIRIKALNSGEASIKVTNTNGNVIAVFHVLVRYFGSKDIWETDEISMDAKNNISIIAEDEEVKQSIEEELWEYVNSMKGTVYTFDDDTKKFTMDVKKLEQKHKGTYSCNGDSLNLNYEGITENYAFKIVAGVIYILKIDKTEKYRVLYPNAGISSVIVERVWYDKDRNSHPKFGLDS